MHDRAENESDPAPKAGDVIAGRFVVEEVLGAGAMGVVVAARSIALKRRVAVKLVKIGSEGYARFEREAIALASLENDHVVRVLEYGTAEDGSPYLVMEFLVGRDLLGELRARGPLPIAEAVDCILEACVGLHEAHAMGIVHRDIKLGNLFLATRPGDAPRIKVLDFGISKLLSPQDFEMSLTHPSATIGSPAYMSPEQVRLAKSVDHRADIWSLGIVLHRLVTGKQPFVGDGFSAVCAAVATDAPPTLRSQREDAPAALESVVLRCLEKDPARRFQSVSALAAALTPFATARGARAAAKIATTTNDISEETRPLPNMAIANIAAPPVPDEIAADTASPATVAPRAMGPARASARGRLIVIGLGIAAAMTLTWIAAPWKHAPSANAGADAIAPTHETAAAQAIQAAPSASSLVGAANEVDASIAPAPALSTTNSHSRSSPPNPAHTRQSPQGASSAGAQPSSAPANSASPPAPFGGKALQSRE